MKSHTLFSIIISMLFFSCNSQISEKDYFNGEIYLINDNVNIKEIYPKKIVLNGDYYGTVSAYDSLIFFWNSKAEKAFFDVYNLKNGMDMGKFVFKGSGPNEFTDIQIINHFYKENEELKTLLFTANEKKFLIWNISQSIHHKTTIYDTIIPYKWNEDNITPYIYTQQITESEIFSYVPGTPITLDGKSSTLPAYQRRTLYTNELLDEYSFFLKNIDGIGSSEFFYSKFYLKPDGNKLIECMRYLKQINIMDINIGEIKGYRIKGSPDFSTFFKDRKSAYLELPCYFTDLQVNNEFILALSAEGKPGIDAKADLIYIFNWNGELVYKLRLKGEHAFCMFLDPVHYKLYTSNQLHLGSDNIYCYDLKTLINDNNDEN